MRYAQTLRYLKASQVAWRLRYRLVKGLGWQRRSRVPGVPPRFNGEALARLRDHARSQVPRAREVARLRGGELAFLQVAVSAGQPLPWADASRGLLWHYHLHYFDYARWLAEAQGEQPNADESALVLGWIHDWMDKNPPGTPVAWDAFCVSARLMNWAVAVAVFGWDDARLRASYAQQVEWLLHNLEWDILGNHLLKNAAALGVAGQLLGGDASWRGRDLLEAQVAEQVLPDGGHYERSPMYHALVLEDLRLVHAACADKPVYLTDAIVRMERWARVMRHPDGGIPLFGDSGLLHDLTEESVEETSAVALTDSGYFIVGWDHGRGASRLFLKACGPEPAYQPGHAHADPFSFELSCGGLRMIVDTGVHGYAASPWRTYCRSARAHNVAVVDGGEPMDAWGVFRVGRRYQTQVLSWAPDRRGGARFVGRHDGFAPRVVERELRADGAGAVWIEDRIASGGEGKLESYLHVHPEVRVEVQANGFLLTRDAVCLWLLPGSQTAIRHEAPRAEAPEGWYFPEFGLGFPSAWFVLYPSKPGVAAVSYALVEAKTLSDARIRMTQLGMDD